ncbi:FxLYD domain-containing protein [Erwinia sp. ACCC 02193]|uniref:FxLYD domain-containing protein n=1 Tax=Erwinia aeris TaxID=3239803 RepID=A0ABV4EDD8_9GAMM
MTKKLVASLILTLSFSGLALAASDNQQVSLSDLQFKNTPNGLRDIEGIGTNTTGKTLKHVFVKFNLLENDTVIGQTIAMVENLEPGQSFKIQAPFNSIEIKPDSFKVTEVNVIN